MSVEAEAVLTFLRGPYQFYEGDLIRANGNVAVIYRVNNHTLWIRYAQRGWRKGDNIKRTRLMTVVRSECEPYDN